MTTATTTDRFPGHQPGEPYELSREEFVLFAGLDRLYRSFVTAQPIVGYCGGEAYEQKAAFWAAIGAFEANRWFSDDNRCVSQLYADERDDNGDLTWFYVSTSGTKLYAREQRSGEGATFAVEIPIDRDQPGRHHYEQLRQGGTYCD